MNFSIPRNHIKISRRYLSEKLLMFQDSRHARLTHSSFYTAMPHIRNVDINYGNLS